MKPHRFIPDPYRCRECGGSRSDVAHSIDPAPASVRVEAVLDLEHLVPGQRVRIEGELYEVRGMP